MNNFSQNSSISIFEAQNAEKAVGNRSRMILLRRLLFNIWVKDWSNQKGNRNQFFWGEVCKLTATLAVTFIEE